MQFCYNCGRTFEDDEIVQKRDGETGLHIYCCPECGVDDIGEAEHCEICDGYFAEGDTAEGFCLECLWKEIDYDVALAFMKDAESLASFMVERMDGKLEHSSLEFDAFMEEAFRRAIANDKLSAQFGGKSGFLEECRYHCLPRYDEESFGPEGREFAEWYSDYKKESLK